MAAIGDLIRDIPLPINPIVRQQRTKKKRTRRNIVGLLYLRSSKPYERKIQNHRIWKKVGEFDISDYEKEEKDEEFLPLMSLNHLNSPRKEEEYPLKKPFIFGRDLEKPAEDISRVSMIRKRSATLPNPEVSTLSEHPSERARTDRTDSTSIAAVLDYLDMRQSSNSKVVRSLSIRGDHDDWHWSEEVDTRKLKRGHALAEILYQEELYIAKLQELISDFLEIIDMQEILHPTTLEPFHRLQVDIRKFLQVHQELRDALRRKCIEIDGEEFVYFCNGDKLRKISFKWARQFHRITTEDALELYKRYISNYDQMMQMIEDERESNPRFFEFLRGREKARKSFFAFLILPVQQITRYRLTFKKLLKCSDASDPDWEQIKILTNDFEECPKKIDEYQKENIERITKLSHIMSLISDMPESVIDEQRHFFLQIKVRKPYKSAFSTKKYNRLFLFNDIIIVTNQRYKYRRYHNLADTILSFIEPKTLQLRVSEEGEIDIKKWTVLKVKKAVEFQKKWKSAKSNQKYAEHWDLSEPSQSLSNSGFDTSGTVENDWMFNNQLDAHSVHSLTSVQSSPMVHSTMAESYKYDLSSHNSALNLAETLKKNLADSQRLRNLSGS